MQGNPSVAYQLAHTIVAAYQHGPMSWTQLRVMIAIVDPAFDELLTTKLEEDHVNFMIFKELMGMAIGQVRLDGITWQEENELQAKAQATLKEFFQKEYFISKFGSLKALNMTLNVLTNVIANNAGDEDMDFAKSCKKAIYERTMLRLKKEKDDERREDN